MKRHYCILIQWPRSNSYSLLWEKKNATLAEANAALAQAQVGWPNKGRYKGRQIFISNPRRAKRLLTYIHKTGAKRVNNLALGLR